MKSSVTTATQQPKLPAKRSLTVTGEALQPQQPDVQDEHDHFFWTYTEEPHRTRRQAIIKAHPEVRCLAHTRDAALLTMCR
jgi:sphingolipid delta-4 desaturase